MFLFLLVGIAFGATVILPVPSDSSDEPHDNVGDSEDTMEFLEINDSDEPNGSDLANIYETGGQEMSPTNDNDQEFEIQLGDESVDIGSDGHDKLVVGENASEAGGDGNDNLYVEDSNTEYVDSRDDRTDLDGESIAFSGAGISSYNPVVDLNQEEPMVISDFVTDDDDFGSISGVIEDGEDIDLEMEYQPHEVSTGTDPLVSDLTQSRGLGADTAESSDTQIRNSLIEDGAIRNTDADNTVSELPNDSANTIFGSGDDDRLFGGADDVLFGGEGDDKLFLEHGARATGGGGSDFFALQYSEDPVFVTDFNEVEDVILVDIGNERLDDGTYVLDYVELHVEPWDNELGADLLVDGHVFAHIAGGQNLQVSDLKIR